ncbi:uncharacterized protein LOC144488336 [Mustelus asterias]
MSANSMQEPWVHEEEPPPDPARPAAEGICCRPAKGFPAAAYGPVAAAAAAARGSGRGARGRGGYMAYPQNVGAGFPDYGFYSTPGDQRASFSFADYGSVGLRAAQMLRSEHTPSASSPSLHHLTNPDQFKNPGSAPGLNSHLLTWPQPLVKMTGTNPPRPGGFPGANSPGRLLISMVQPAKTLVSVTT